ncbi:TPA_asm: coat protein [ssRNA phage Gephyllon.3_18]|uniref:Coat protein n=2 Tax=Leviviricetes TaxID=2842243 RepID=A0A8S5L4G9_9VIRU|nr:coat protein [ssRNA phage Gephyllon.3_18]QDH86575.1 MAG: hypothetical protein H3BulkLitter17996_000002 [Leviviridae sp.]DAD52090.1 TPA_asm: coat protein [ssRNA phage Gephyllon.3_18]
MAFVDPIDIVYNSVTVHLPRVETGGRRSVYKSVDDIFTLTISHTEQKNRVRTVVRLDRTIVVPDPVSAVNDYDTCTIQTVIERPKFGFTMTDVERQSSSMGGLLTNATIDKLFGTES